MRDQVSGFRGSSHGRAQVLGGVAQVARVSKFLEFTHVQELGQHCQDCRQSCMRAWSQAGSSQVLGRRFMFQPLCPKPCPTSARVLKHPKLEPQAKVLLGDTTPRFCVGNPFQPVYMCSPTDRIFFPKVQEPTGEQLVAPNFQESALALQGADAQGLGGIHRI
jgi:hypothetical protein